MPILSLLIALTLFCFLVWAAFALLNAFAIPEPIRTVVFVVIVALGLLAIVNWLGGVSPGLPLRLR